MTEKAMIPLFVIDALISTVKEESKIVSLCSDSKEIMVNIIKALEKIKKETIPIPTQPLIPMSVVDVRIKEYEEMKSEVLIRYNNYTDREYSARKLTRLDGMIDTLERIKKEAIPVQGQKHLPECECNCEDLIGMTIPGQPLERSLSSLTCPWCGFKTDVIAQMAMHFYQVERMDLNYDHWYRLAQFISSKQSGNKPLEQRILQRIKSLEYEREHLVNDSGAIVGNSILTRIDELRKLLPK